MSIQYTVQNNILVMPNKYKLRLHAKNNGSKILIGRSDKQNKYNIIWIGNCVSDLEKL